MSDIAAITGTIDAAALCRLARGDGATRLATILDSTDRVALQLGDSGRRELPIELRAYELPEDANEDDADVDRGYHVHAAVRAVAIAHRDIPPVRWVYLGRGCTEVEGACRAALLTSDDSAWHDPWGEPAIASTADGAIRVVAWREYRHVKAILIASATPIALYLGFDADDEAVALVLDACGLGGICDDRDDNALFHATQQALAVAPLGAFVIPRWHRVDDFLPNLADGVPQFAEDEPLATPWPVTATLVGTLPLPSGTLAIRTGEIDQDVWPAADRLAVIAVLDTDGHLMAWLLRADDVRPVRWQDVGFSEDVCAIGDPEHLDVPDGGWPRGVDLALARSTSGATLVCVSGPNLTMARGAVGFDVHGRVMALVAVS